MGAHQLALVPRQPVRAGRADLAVMINRLLLGWLCLRGTGHTTLWEFGGKFIVEDMGPVGEHG